MKSVAQRAGVDPSTASRVLAAKPEVRVSTKTREKILKAASELNYRPNSIARSLKTRRTFAIAMFIPDVGNPVYAEILRGVELSLDESAIAKRAKVPVKEVRRISDLVRYSSHKRKFPPVAKIGLRTPGFDWREGDEDL